MAKYKFTVIGKRWFQKLYGNTYHSVHIINNETGEDHYIPFSYGYDDGYLQTALGWMEDNKWIGPIVRYPNGGREGSWQTCEREGISYQVSDVQRKKDL